MNTKSISLATLRTLAPAAALGAAALLLVPAGSSLGFTTLGGTLSAGGQRDFRAYKNVTGTGSTATSPNYPGWLGFEQALWKAAAEWGSGPHGTGSGDPTQPVIGSGGANFDFFFAGAAQSAGNDNQNIVSFVQSCSGGLLAYVNTPIDNGWTMRFCLAGNNWRDDPGTVAFYQNDTQSVGTHEFGHALGLGHASGSGQSMQGVIPTGTVSFRSIEADDIAGVQFLYGVASPNKPRITAATVDILDPLTGTVTLTGQNFAPTGNEVWFTRALPSAAGDAPQVSVTGVSSTGGGTSISIALPPLVGSGDIAVKVPGVTHDTLSNAWPVDLSGFAGPPLGITAITPDTVESLVPGPDRTVTVSGFGFTPATTLTIDGIPVDPSLYVVVDDDTIEIDMPQVSALGPIPVQVDDGSETASSSITVVAPTTPVLQVASGVSTGSQISSSDPLVVTYAGPPGEFHFVIGSGSNTPSILPIVSLCLGNNFTDLFETTSGIIGPAGYNQATFSLLPGTFALWFFQDLTFSQGKPIPTSNCQQLLVLP